MTGHQARRPRPAPWVAAAMAAFGLILAGCANLPTGGVVKDVNSLPNSDQAQESQIVMTPRPPGANWQSWEIVSGFLAASGASPNDLSIARQYLTARYDKAWHPSPTPDIIDTNSKVAPTQAPTRVTGGQPSAQQVTVKSDDLETLVAAGENRAGRLQIASQPGPHVFTFELLQVKGSWRIDSIIVDGKTSHSIRFLTTADFERDYLPRNLYYLASGSPGTLVPYPVYIPRQTEQFGVQQLVDAVRRLPPAGANWLYHAIATAFPRGSKLTVQVHSSQAVVTLGGAAARADVVTLGQMEAQLVWTLTYSPDSAGTGITSVEFHIGRTSEYAQGSSFTSWIPQGPSGPLYYQTLGRGGRPLLESFRPGSNFGLPSVGGAAGTQAHAAGKRASVLLPRGLGRGPLTTVAVSPAPPRGVNTFAGCRGKTAYVVPLLVNSDLLNVGLPGNCTSLSWDAQGDLWAVAGSDVYVLNEKPTGLQVIPVSILAQQITASDRFITLKVAPDGLRVAMIIRGQNSASVYVSAVTKKQQSSTIYLAQGGPLLTAGPDLVNPIALTWWDSDHLLVLDRRHGASLLYLVPLNGGQSTRVVTAPLDAVSVAANGSYIAVGTPGSPGHGQGSVLVSHGLNGDWVRIGAGSASAYLG